MTVMTVHKAPCAALDQLVLLFCFVLFFLKRNCYMLLLYIIIITIIIIIIIMIIISQTPVFCGKVTIKKFLLNNVAVCCTCKFVVRIPFGGGRFFPRVSSSVTERCSGHSQSLSITNRIISISLLGKPWASPGRRELIYSCLVPVLKG